MGTKLLEVTIEPNADASIMEHLPSGFEIGLESEDYDDDGTGHLTYLVTCGLSEEELFDKALDSLPGVVSYHWGY